MVELGNCGRLMALAASEDPLPPLGERAAADPSDRCPLSMSADVLALRSMYSRFLAGT